MSLKFYADSGKSVQSVVIDKKPILESSPAEHLIERPNRCRIGVANQVTAVCDGRRLVVKGAVSGAPFKTPAPRVLDSESLRRIPVEASDLYTTLCSGGMQTKIILDFLFDPDARRTMMKPSGAVLKIGRDVVIDDKPIRRSS